MGMVGDPQVFQIKVQPESERRISAGISTSLIVGKHMLSVSYERIYVLRAASTDKYLGPCCYAQPRF